MSDSRSELRIPADRSFIVVAKRAAAGFASVAGLHVEAVDDVVIAVTQACEHAIARLHGAVGEDCGQLRLEFRIGEGRLDVQVRSVCSRAEIESARKRALAQAEERERQRRLHDEVERQRTEHELALQLLSVMVDDFGYRVDDQTGGVRVRLTKFKVS